MRPPSFKLLGTLVLAVSTAYSADVTDPFTPIVGSSTNFPNPNETPAHAIDNSVNTKYLNFDRENTGFTVTLPAARTIRALNFLSANDAPERDPATFELLGSNDGSSFTSILTGTLAFPDRRSSAAVTLAGPATYSSYKVVFPSVANAATANSMQIGEVQFLEYGDILAGATITGNPGTYGGGETPDKLNDGRLGTKMGVAGNESRILTIVPSALYNGYAVNGFTFFSANDNATSPGRHPTSLLIEGTNDGTNFSTIYNNGSLGLLDANWALQEFSFANSTAYGQYRVTLGAPSNGGFMQISEIQMYGAVPEPTSVVLLGIGAGLLLRRSRSKVVR